MKSLIYLLIGLAPIILFVIYIFFDIIINIMKPYGWKTFIKYFSVVILISSWIIFWMVLAARVPF